MPSYHNIPDNLKQYTQWVVWRGVNRTGKVAKMPFQSTSPYRPASVADPKTWGTFSQVMNAYQSGAGDGIGFVFHQPDSFTGVDLDHCRNVQTGELEHWAKTIIAELDSYTEISPSGTGVHIIVQGQLPMGGRRKGNIEMYDNQRFFCVTGNHLGDTPTDVNPRQVELERFHSRIFPALEEGRGGSSTTVLHIPSHDEEIIRRALQAKNSAKFAKLWRGDWQDDYPSQSEADLALCGQLAFWTGGDPKQTDRLFRQSALYREKWAYRSHADGPTYGERTVEKALNSIRGINVERRNAS